MFTKSFSFNHKSSSRKYGTGILYANSSEFVTFTISLLR